MDTRAVAEELRVRRDQLTAELDVVTVVERDPDASVSFGKRVGDGTTAAVERLNLVGTARELQAMLHDVDRALVKLEDGTYSGVIPRCQGVVAFSETLRGCEAELQSVLEDWILLGLKLGHDLPVMEGIDLNREPTVAAAESL